MPFGRKKSKQEQEEATARLLLASELATLRTIMERYPAGSMLSFGSPSRCPECGDYGIVRGVSHAKGASDNYCRVCRRDWVITARALQAYYLASANPTSPLTAATSMADEEPTFATEPSPVEHPVEPAAADTAPALVAEPVQPADRVPVVHETRAADLVAEPPAEPGPAGVTDPVATSALPPPPAAAPTAEALVAPVEGAADPAAVAVDLTEPLPTLRVLVVDDNLFDFAMIEELLEPFISSGEIVLEHRATRRQGEEAARSFPFDVVLLDLDLHDTNGLTTVLEWNHRAGEPLPLIALIDEPDAELTQQTAAAGIHAVIQKAHVEKLTTQGDAGQRRLHKLIRDTATKNVDEPVDRRWGRSRTKAPGRAPAGTPGAAKTPL